MATQIINISKSFSLTSSKYNSTNVNTTITKEQIRYYFTFTGNPETNTSTVKIDVQVYLEGSKSYYTLTYKDMTESNVQESNYVKFEGNTYKYSPTLGKNVDVKTWTTIATINIDKTFQHSTNGQKTFTVSGKNFFNFVDNVNGTTTYPCTNASYSDTSVSVTITRASTVSCPTGYIGEPLTISILKTASEHTNTLYYEVFTDEKYTELAYEYLIAEKTSDTSITWTIPTELFAYIPNKSVLYCDIRYITYDGNTSLGSRWVECNARVREETSKPLLENFIVKETNPDIFAVTGDENIIIKNYGTSSYSIEVTPRNSATIVEQYIQNGSKKVTGASGVIEDVDSGVFTFTAIDSRGFITTATIEKEIIDYLKPTCFQEIEKELRGETELVVNLTVKGSYFNDAIGNTNNTLRLEVSYGLKNGEMCDWVPLNGTPIFKENNTYELSASISGLDYRNAYSFKCRAVDVLNTAETATYIVKIIPVFDWSENDFNFNVPVNFNASMNFNDDLNVGDYSLKALGNYLTKRYQLTVSTSPGANYNSVTASAYLYTGFLRIYFTATRASNTTAGNVTDETMMTLTINDGGKIANYSQGSITPYNASAIFAGYSGNLTRTTDTTFTVNITLTATNAAMSSFNGFIIMPIVPQLEKYK